MTLLGGKEWTDQLDFAASIVVRADTQFADSSQPYTVRLEQIYREVCA